MNIISKTYVKRVPLGVLVLGLVAGCAGFSGPVETQYALTFSKDDIHNIPSALEATAEQFFSGPSSGPVAAGAQGAAQGGAIVVDIGKDTLSAQSGTAYFEQSSRKLQLRAGLERPLDNHVAVIGGVSLSRGNSRYLLPEGAGVLVDPITILFNTAGVEIDAGLAIYTGKRIESRLEMGVGATLTNTKTRITSALLDVSNTSVSGSGFIYTGVQLGLIASKPGQPDLRLQAQVKYYPDAGVSIRSGLSFAF